jgi:hypothetical protein
MGAGAPLLGARGTIKMILKEYVMHISLPFTPAPILKFIILVAFFGFVIRFLPLLLQRLKVEGKVLENVLSLVYAVLIIYFIIYFVVIPFMIG